MRVFIGRSQCVLFLFLLHEGAEPSLLLFVLSGDAEPFLFLLLLHLDAAGGEYVLGLLCARLERRLEAASAGGGGGAAPGGGAALVVEKVVVVVVAFAVGVAVAVVVVDGVEWVGGPNDPRGAYLPKCSSNLNVFST